MGNSTAVMSNDDIAQALKGVAAVETAKTPRAKPRSRCQYCGDLFSTRGMRMHEASCEKNPNKDDSMSWTECPKCHVNVEIRAAKKHIESCSGDPVKTLFRIWKNTLHRRRLTGNNASWSVMDEMTKRNFDFKKMKDGELKKLNDLVEAYEYKPHEIETKKTKKPGRSSRAQRAKNVVMPIPKELHVEEVELVILRKDELMDDLVSKAEVEGFIWKMRAKCGLDDEFLQWSIETLVLFDRIR